MAEIVTSNTRKRLGEIESELEGLAAQKATLKEKWEREKFYIQEIRTIKADIENLKRRADELERSGELGKVAEIRYGTLLSLDKRLKDVNDKLLTIQKSGKMLKEEVDAEDIADIVSRWTHIPVSRMLESEKQKLINMEERLHRRLVGQNDAVRSVANAIRRSRAGLQDAARPIGSFIFLGSTGVGKTEMAKALAEYLFDDESAMVRIDMSEYMEKYSVSRLIGAPPGYVGYEEGGQLTESVRRKPYSVILLDEIEKANTDVFNILLQVLDDGRLTDGKGRTVNFRNTIIIMTSNIGTDLIQEKLSLLGEENRDAIIPSIKPQIIEMLKKYMRPEFLNRVDEIILFKPLSTGDIHQIASLQMEILRTKLASLSMGLRVSDRALDWLSTIGYDTHYGARPLKRTIQKHIADPLALKLLSNEFIAGDKILIDSNDNGEFLFLKDTG